MKELDFYLMEENMGAQYHQYLFGILLTNPKNKAFIYNNYMGMLVKHYYHSHVDFAFDGILHQHYFRHDLLIFGYDERKKTYRTAGFDERFNFGITDYLWGEIELAYGTMQNEWDYEFFVFSVVDAYEEYYDLPHIKSELQMYLQGKNPI